MLLLQQEAAGKVLHSTDPRGDTKGALLRGNVKGLHLKLREEVKR